VSNVLKKCGVPASHEWIYQNIHDDTRNKGILYRHLRQGLKRYRKAKRTKAEAIKNAISIDERPAIVDTKKYFGDWEIDTFWVNTIWALTLPYWKGRRVFIL
jgi:IS30 family transposase